MLKRNYRNIHYWTLAFVALMILTQFFGWIVPEHKQVIYVFIFLIYGLVTSRFHGPFEKKDELTKLNLGRASGITLWTVIVFLFIFAVMGEIVSRKDIMASDVYFYTSFSAIALRSIIFLIIDKTPEEGEDGE